MGDLYREYVCSGCSERELCRTSTGWTSVFCAHQHQQPTLEFCAQCTGSSTLIALVDATLTKLRASDSQLLGQWDAYADIALASGKHDLCYAFRRCADDLEHRFFGEWNIDDKVFCGSKR